MQKVVFDSSFLMAVAEVPTTWFDDMVQGLGRFQPVLLDCVKAELSALAASQGRKSRSARVALELASKFEAGACGSGSVDDEVVSYALSNGAVVATADSQMIHSLRAAHARAVTLRQGRVSLS
ncbi:MAG: hypothetical protein JRN28_03450 [Nitrososphaerota archaeon]|nr:hypothetical protein [Nitrososphaerota archaeon]